MVKARYLQSRTKVEINNKPDSANGLRTCFWVGNVFHRAALWALGESKWKEASYIDDAIGRELMLGAVILERG